MSRHQEIPRYRNGVKLITNAQIAMMEQRGLDYDDEMTAKEASDAITEDVELSPHPFSDDAFAG